MWAFLGSDCMLFGSLIGTYLVYRGRYLAGPKPTDVFDIPYTSVSALALLMSSLAMVLALAAIQRGDIRRLKIWLLCVAGLGLVFIGGQVYEFTSFGEEGLNLAVSTFGTTFFVLTGFHGTHVTFGIVWLLMIWIMAKRGQMTQARSLDVEIAGLYWHFVDIVWIIIFTVVYLIPV
ncbi:MAG: cytochrome oxidase subunit III [Chloroflexi bacterium]|nr:cytochrome oxidase subunit III [Chloroflexota bacterium]